MKKSVFLLLLLFFNLSFIFSQEFSLKYGKVTEDELKMTTYPNDTAATAVVLYDDGSTYYNYNQDFQVITEVKKKIKILKQAGTNEANISIPFFYNNSSTNDNISKLEAFTYNLENGKIVKSKVEKKYIFEENIGKNYKQIKFTFPNVKVGSVIEYKYEKISNRYFDMPDKTMQRDIPIKNIRYETIIPEYFIYNIETRGYESININKENTSQTFTVYSEGKSYPVTCTSTRTVYSMENVPALKDEDYVWDLTDYLSAVRFELSGTNFPGSMYKSYTNSWTDIEKLLKEQTDFVSNIKKSTPFDKEIKVLVSQSKSDKEVIEGIISLVRSKVKWDGTYSFIDNDPKEALKKTTGNNAQINSIFMGALKEAGYKAYPILMSQRSNGRLPYTHPTTDKLSTFIVGIDGKDDKKYYIDGSSKYGGVNMLPVDLMVDRAYVFDGSGVEKWVDLTKISNNQEIYIINANIDNEGVLHANLDLVEKGEDAYYFKNNFRIAKDSTEYLERVETRNEIKIEKMNWKGMDLLSNVVENHVEFTKKYEIAGDYIYINPMIFKHVTSNPFTDSDRKLPVEFNYPYTYVYTANIVIPENYTVSELPKSLRAKLNDNQAKCTYVTGMNENTVQISYRFDLNQIIYPQTDYKSIQELWGQLALKNTEMIVLKKK